MHARAKPVNVHLLVHCVERYLPVPLQLHMHHGHASHLHARATMDIDAILHIDHTWKHSRQPFRMDPNGGVAAALEGHGLFGCMRSRLPGTLTLGVTNSCSSALLAMLLGPGRLLSAATAGVLLC